MSATAAAEASGHKLDSACVSAISAVHAVAGSVTVIAAVFTGSAAPACERLVEICQRCSRR